MNVVDREQDSPAEPADSERWLTIGGRRWRRTDPSLPDDLLRALKSHLGRGRSGVRSAKLKNDDDATASARVRVGLAKRGLGARQRELITDALANWARLRPSLEAQ